MYHSVQRNKYCIKTIAKVVAVAGLTVFTQSALALPLGTDYFASTRYNFSGFNASSGLGSFQTDGAVSANGVNSSMSGQVLRIDNDLPAAQASSASADLSTGELRALSSVTNFGGIGNSNAGTTTWAAFGDSLIHQSDSGQPFLFNSGETALFNLTIDGVLGTSLIAENIQTQAWLRLFILEPGSLSDVVNDGGGIFCCGEPEVVANAIDVMEFGLTPTTVYGSNLLGSIDDIIPIDVLSDGQFQYEFSLDSDFDFYMELVTNSFISTDFGTPLGGRNHFAVTDFFNTITVGYQAPVGATAFSASGLFPGTMNLANAPVDVPEPSSLLLITAGVAGLGFVMRKKKKV